MVASYMLEHYYGKAKRTLLRNRALLRGLAGRTRGKEPSDLERHSAAEAGARSRRRITYNARVSAWLEECVGGAFGAAFAVRSPQHTSVPCSRRKR